MVFHTEKCRENYADLESSSSPISAAKDAMAGDSSSCFTLLDICFRSLSGWHLPTAEKVVEIDKLRKKEGVWEGERRWKQEWSLCGS